MSTFLAIFGSLGVFLFGMKLLSEGLQKVSGNQLRNIMKTMTQDRVRGVFTGTAVTSVIQSSSATTVMVVSFVNAGLLTLSESVGVIMGANLGTTLTAWIVAIFGFKFSLSSVALPIIGVGMAMMFMKSPRKHDIGECFVGFGILFLGLSLLKDAVPPVKEQTETLAFLANYSDMGMWSVLLFVGIGVLLTVTVQSSSAAMAITITMAAKGWIEYDIAAAIVMGENIGTTITANLAALPASLNAKRAALIHLFFNMIGVCWLLLIFPFFVELTDFITPGNAAEPEHIPIFLSAFHTLFNTINIVLLIGFAPQLVKLVERIGPKQTEKTDAHRFEYISTGTVSTGSLNVIEAEMEVSRLAEMGLELFDGFVELYSKPPSNPQQRFKELSEIEDASDELAFDITRFLSHCGMHEVSEERADSLAALYMIVGELEEINDSCYRLAQSVTRAYRNNITYPESERKAMDELIGNVRSFMLFIHNNIKHRAEVSTMEDACQHRDMIKMRIKGLRQSHTELMHRNGDVDAGMSAIELLNYLKSTNSDLFNVMQSLGYRK